MRLVRHPAIILVTLAILVFAAASMSVGGDAYAIAPSTLSERSAFERESVDPVQDSRRIAAYDHWGRGARVLIDDEVKAEDDVEIRVVGVTTVGGRRQALLLVDPATLDSTKDGERVSSGLVRVSQGDALTESIAVRWIGADSIRLTVENVSLELFVYPKE